MHVKKVVDGDWAKFILWALDFGQVVLHSTGHVDIEKNKEYSKIN